LDSITKFLGLSIDEVIIDSNFINISLGYLLDENKEENHYTKKFVTGEMHETIYTRFTMKTISCTTKVTF